MVVEFKVRYDRVGNTLYVLLKDDKVVESEEVEPGIIVDYNMRGEVVGIEVLWASRRRIDLSRLLLEGPGRVCLALVYSIGGGLYSGGNGGRIRKSISSCGETCVIARLAGDTGYLCSWGSVPFKPRS